MSTTTTVELRGLRRRAGARRPSGERHLRVVPPLGREGVEEAVAPAGHDPLDGTGTAGVGPGGPRPEACPARTRVPRGEDVPDAVADGGRRGAGSAARVTRTLAARLDLDGLRLTARGRFVVAVAALALVAPVAWGATTAVAGAPAEPVEVRAHAVEPGETLWELAASVARPGQDVRDVVRRLQELNDLPTGGLTVGQTLYVPAG
ncbi:LysM peptidoglycan-binding domain-containing protein [Myceligenerans salitolerans]|uniref:LysM peptidoglycan-binding domain-containing protein n=1 Tax=Myceligenerans salitolerans TaxID=1230528 RepID=A0ABS3I4B3_9MICO|nr:LysM peptidoglycan-binding domain-containing protein [Myceligenerans salitolerans]MBO0607456.1 LysM peptidoglycan-binding domain-containing protein [Myceligenerans salitolerans]